MLKGSKVIVARGRSDVGFSGLCFWSKMCASSNSKYGGGKPYLRVGIKNDAGDVVWAYGRNVDVMDDAVPVDAIAAAAAPDPVDWSKVSSGSDVSEAYGGHWACSLPLSAFPSDWDDKRIASAIRAKYPAGSSWGALRWPRGASSISVERENGLVAWMDGYGMCD